MLVLTRKINESIMLNDDIEITIVAIDGDQIKIGIDAPRSVDIHRKEIYLSIQEENKEAITIDMDMIAQMKTMFLEENKEGK